MDDAQSSSTLQFQLVDLTRPCFLQSHKKVESKSTITSVRAGFTPRINLRLTLIRD